jgi:hypothetical protein
LPAVTVALRVLVPEEGFERRQFLERDVRAPVLIELDDLLAPAASYRDGNDILSEHARFLERTRLGDGTRARAGSCSSRPMAYSRRRFPAVSIMPPVTG